GYVEEPKEDLEQAKDGCIREQRWNLARVYMSSWRYPEALELLEELHAEVPERGDVALGLADCQQRLGLLEEAIQTVKAAIENHRDTPKAQFLLGAAEFERGNIGESLKHLEAAEQAEPRMPHLHVRIGWAYVKQRHWKHAERAFHKALDID